MAANELVRNDFHDVMRYDKPMALLIIASDSAAHLLASCSVVGTPCSPDTWAIMLRKSFFNRSIAKCALWKICK